LIREVPYLNVSGTGDGDELEELATEGLSDLADWATKFEASKVEGLILVHLVGLLRINITESSKLFTLGKRENVDIGIIGDACEHKEPTNITRVSLDDIETLVISDVPYLNETLLSATNNEIRVTLETTHLGNP
jgi:hypothetical protein